MAISNYTKQKMYPFFGINQQHFDLNPQFNTQGNFGASTQRRTPQFKGGVRVYALARVCESQHIPIWKSWRDEIARLLPGVPVVWCCIGITDAERQAYTDAGLPTHPFGDMIPVAPNADKNNPASYQAFSNRYSALASGAARANDIFQCDNEIHANYDRPNRPAMTASNAAAELSNWNDTFRSNNPTIKITPGAHYVHNWWPQVVTALKNLRGNNNYDIFDYLSCHPYYFSSISSNIGKTPDQGGYVTYAQTFYNEFRASSTKPVLATEYGHDSYTVDSSSSVKTQSDNQLDQFLFREAEILSDIGYAGGYWYQYRDEYRVGTHGQFAECGFCTNGDNEPANFDIDKQSYNTLKAYNDQQETSIIFPVKIIFTKVGGGLGGIFADTISFTNAEGISKTVTHPFGSSKLMVTVSPMNVDAAVAEYNYYTNDSSNLTIYIKSSIVSPNTGQFCYIIFADIT